MTLLDRPLPSSPTDAPPAEASPTQALPSAAPTFVPPGPPPHRKFWTGKEYDRLVDAGAFDGQRIELIDGEVYEMSPMGDPHVFTIILVQYALLRCFLPDAYTVKVQLPFKLNDASRPEPDLGVYSGPPHTHRTTEFKPLLAVEVSHSTLPFDRNTKLPAYAAQQLPEVWIVNVAEKAVEVYRNPHEVVGGAWTYDRPQVFRGDEAFASLIDPAAVLKASELLG